MAKLVSLRGNRWPAPMASRIPPLALAIRRARLAQELTQEELATRVGVSQGTISFWENGVEIPRLEHVILLALELPAIIEQFEGRERELLQRVMQLERELFAGRCACRGCNCSPDEPSTRTRPTLSSSPYTTTKELQMKIAVTGKGGVGKTTIAGTLARLLAQSSQHVLAIDGDSNPNLAYSIGIAPDEANQLPTVPAGLTEWRQDENGKAYVHLHQPVAQFISDYSSPAPDGVRLMVLGEVVKASAGCRCSSHAVARGITHHLVTEADIVVLDMEAGLEHLGRGTAEHVDVLLVVVEPYYRALEAGARIYELAAQLDLPHILVVANRVRTQQEREAIVQFCRNHGLELVATIPYDETIQTAEQRGEAPIDGAADSVAVQAMANLAAVLQTRVG